MKKLSLIVIIVVVLIVGAALAMKHKSTNTNNYQTNSSNTTKPSSTEAKSTGSISITNMMFTPSQITVAKGGTVTWTNNDATTHTVVDDLTNVGGPSSGQIAPGGTYSFTFTKTGSFQYHCSIHPSMRGTIVVK